MTLHHVHYTTTRPIFSRLRVMRQALKLATLTGSTTETISELFHQARVRVNISGNVSAWNTSGTGTLLVGDHRLGIEVIPLCAIFGHFGRNDMHFIAKPFAHSARLLCSIHQDHDMILPVIPGTLASDRPNIWNRDFCWRITQRDILPTRQQLKRLNFDTIHRSAELIAQGSLVTIFPVGSVSNAIAQPWRSGLGAIVNFIPTSIRDGTNVVLFRFDDFSPVKILRSLILQSYGVQPRPNSLTLRVSPSMPISELVGNCPKVDATSITEELRRRFIQCFN